jgi:hypothetical protein
MKGYLGSLGVYAVAAGDALARPFVSDPERPARDWLKTATFGIGQKVDSEQSFYVNYVWRQSKELEQAYNTFNQLKKDGKAEEALAYFEANRDRIAAYKQLDRIRDRQAEIAKRIRLVENSPADADTKREKINALRAAQDRVARAVSVR